MDRSEYRSGADESSIALATGWPEMPGAPIERPTKRQM